MKKFSLVALLLVSSFLTFDRASALPACSQYGPSCYLHPYGLTEVMLITPLSFPNGTYPFYGFSETEFNSLGLSEYITWNGANPDVAPAGPPNPMTIRAVQQLKVIVDGKLATPAGTSSQYVGGDGGALHTLPGAGSRTFNYPSRALNSCFQISSTKDADFHYKIDVTTGLSLTAGSQGTATATSYTNSGCTTGAQAVADGTSSQTGTLVVGLAINQIVSISLDGTLPSGKWIKVTTANTVGTPTFAIRAVQSEVIYP